jgi:hypothetical protein
MRWVGIDEAGYGPNLGPMVMTAVVAEGPGQREPHVWGDLVAGVARAGDSSGRLWVDDSKAILRHPAGRARLEETCLALLAAAGCAAPGTMADLLAAVGAGTPDEAELTAWLASDGPEGGNPGPAAKPDQGSAVAPLPFEGASWRIVGVQAVVVGPARFNAGLKDTGSKARVHFAAFVQLLGPLWHHSQAGDATHVRGDKHGGRHFYYEPLIDAFPDLWIDRGPEGPASSRYTLRAPGRRLDLCLEPRADAEDGLVALASIVSKTIRERWMDAFNAYWAARIPGLRPTAGYPLDAQRFREAIEPHCASRNLHPDLWWRRK